MMDYLNNMTVFDWLGIVGSLMICAGYFAVSNKWVQADSRRYHMVNLAGAGLLLWSLYHRPNPGAILIEVIWLMIALQALVRGLFNKSGADGEQNTP